MNAWDGMHRDLWIGLRRVERGEPPGDYHVRHLLMQRGLIEWVPGESGTRMTPAGERALETRRTLLLSEPIRAVY